MFSAAIIGLGEWNRKQGNRELRVPRRRRLQGSGNAAGGPFPTATCLGFAGFLFPLLKPMLWVGGNPAIRQQSLQGSRVAGGDRHGSRTPSLGLPSGHPRLFRSTI
ncbi:MAG: hypothetical protein ABSG53_18905 [Thermoguttaceae bacterium]